MVFTLSFVCIDDLADERLLDYLGGLSEEEQRRVLSYKFTDDQKRCLLSHLLQHHLVRELFHLSPDEYAIRRTKENKPFLADPENKFGNFNFNVSHHGKYVGIVSHDRWLVYVFMFGYA